MTSIVKSHKAEKIDERISAVGEHCKQNAEYLDACEALWSQTQKSTTTALLPRGVAAVGDVPYKIQKSILSVLLGKRPDFFECLQRKGPSTKALWVRAHGGRREAPIACTIDVCSRAAKLERGCVRRLEQAPSRRV